METEGPTSRQEAKQAIARLIEEYLKRENCTLGELAAKLGMHRVSLSRIVNQKVLPDATTCRALGVVLGVPEEQVLVAAGYLLPGQMLAASIINNPASQLTELDDPELTLYLSQIGQMPQKTREIVKLILRQEYEQLVKQGQQVPLIRRPAFARPYRLELKAEAEKEEGLLAPAQVETSGGGEE
jgi:transcriptional regulator with XRE-family HTH domain